MAEWLPDRSGKPGVTLPAVTEDLERIAGTKADG